tara:strand:- start:1980 stop:3725 length:1746 start_codon:yes stop_codon:yes gene_type:complete
MIALYPGAFKPPHRGHFNVVKSLLDGSYSGAIYDKDNYKEKGTDILGGSDGEKPEIDKVIIFVGGGERNGITKDEAMSIWQIYAQKLGNVEILDGQKNPMFAAKDYAQANPDTPFAAITGIRGDADFVDLRRITTFKNAPNVKGLAFAAAPDSKVRATDFRKSILDGNLDQIIDFFPKELGREEILDILTGLKDKIVAEVIASNIGGYLTEWFAKEEIERPEGVPPETTKENRPSYTEHIGSIIEYMLDTGMNIQPLPEIKVREDEENAKKFFGKTAYYDPNEKEIVLYATGRHPKDICRSFAHEMVHHIQNLEGRLHNVQTQDTTSDSALMDLEKEAYTVGNITFRNWEDDLKKRHNTKDEKKKLMAEGKYDKISNTLSAVVFETYKKAHDAGKKEIQISFRVGNPEHDEVDIPSLQFEFDLEIYAKFTEDTYKVDGGANAGYDNEGDEIQPMMSIKFLIPKNPDWQEISFDLKDVVRHELEHLTQDGENVRPGKYIEDDAIVRGLIDMGMMDKDDYYQLPKEVDAMIQGMYYKAKKSKTPFTDVVEDYFEKAQVKLENRKKIRILWNKRLPKLGIKQRL